ncbi:hypothetical protein BD770DRAFT_416403 [Pilaira anomala]|nr:hypothetical protein BD770DRAFT_416403 [Pilaira anomala]
MYQLESQEASRGYYEVSHIRFCYDGRFVAMFGRVELERSIYRVCKKIGSRTHTFDDRNKKPKVFEPFVTRVYKSNNEKCLMGFYMFNNNKQLETNFLELNIDYQSNVGIRWKTDMDPRYMDTHEIKITCLTFNYHLKCGYITIGKVKYLIRFGKHTIQLCWASPHSKKEDNIGAEDKLLYIRVYKGPDYGLRCSWNIYDVSTIKFVGDQPLVRLLVNIRNKPYWYAWFLFGKILLSHVKKKLKLLNQPLENIDINSNFFSTISGSRTLAMLVFFSEGRRIIVLIVEKPVPISSFSYHRPFYELFRLLFNRMLLDSKKLGPGCLSASTDALIFLPENGSDRLLDSSKKLLYLNIEADKLAILRPELNINSSRIQTVANFRALESHSIKEQLQTFYAFNILLSTQVAKYFQEKFNDKITSEVDSSLGSFTIKTANLSADNAFVNWFKAFFRRGYTLMTSTVEGIKQRGKEVWASHFAEKLYWHKKLEFRKKQTDY